MGLKVDFNCSSIAEITKGSLDLSQWAKQYFPVLVKKYTCGKKKDLGVTPEIVLYLSTCRKWACSHTWTRHMNPE